MDDPILSGRAKTTPVCVRRCPVSRIESRMRLYLHWQGQQPPEDHAWLPLKLLLSDGQAWMREALRQSPEDDLRLQAGKRRAQTEMDALAKRKDAILRAAHVEFVGVGVVVGVAVGRRQQNRQMLARLHLHITQGYLLTHTPPRQLHRRIVAQQFGDGAWNQRWIVYEALVFRGLAKQRQHA